MMGINREKQKLDAIDEYSQTLSDEPAVLNDNDPTTAIIYAQYAQAFLDKSVTLAKKIQDQFGQAGRNDLGVKQKGLEVLAGSAMPGVLVEIGFITNAEEEAYLNSEKGQRDVAMSIYKGIKAYKADMEK